MHVSRKLSELMTGCIGVFALFVVSFELTS